MLQQLAHASGAQLWAIGSMFLFITVFVVMALRALLGRAEHLERLARLPLDDDGARPATLPGAVPLSTPRGEER